MFEITKNILKEVYQPRNPNVRKYDFGLVLVIGGGQFYTGNPAFAAMAAFRAGADMVHVLAPERAANIIASFSPNLASFPLKGKWLDQEDLPSLIAMVESAKMVSDGKTSVVIGGGLGRSEETKDAVLGFLRQIDVPCVIDADGIHAIAKNPDIIKERPFLITPHAYEFFVLTGEKVEGLPLEQKMAIVRDKAEELQTTILLKGPVDIISSPEEEIALNKTGSPYMTVGGTGDTLAGVAGALMARNTNPHKTACAASFINGAAGRMAAKKLGESMLATDLIEQIPNILKKI